VLLSSQHEDSKDELGSQEHLDKKPLDYSRVSSKSGSNVEVTWKHTLHEAGSGDPAKDLSDEQQATSYPGQCTDQTHAESDLQ
jgi:hypothetical protein